MDGNVMDFFYYITCDLALIFLAHTYANLKWSCDHSHGNKDLLSKGVITRMP